MSHTEPAGSPRAWDLGPRLPTQPVLTTGLCPGRSARPPLVWNTPTGSAAPQLGRLFRKATGLPVIPTTGGCIRCAWGGGAPCSWEGPRVSHPDAAWPRAPARRVKALSSVPARSIVAPSGPSTCSAFPPASSDDVPTSRPGSVFYRYAHYQQLNFGTNRTEAIFPNIARKKKIFSWRIPLTNSVQKPDVSTGRQGGRERRAVSRRRGPATRREGGKQGSSGARFPAWVVVLWQKLSGPPQVARAFTPFPPSSVHVRPLHTRSSPSSLADPRVR